MSRGPGAVMRATQGALRAAGMADTLTLTGAVFGVQVVSQAQASSVRRALRSLEAAGQAVDLGRGFRYGRRMWATPQRGAEYRDRVRRVFGKG